MKKLNLLMLLMVPTGLVFPHPHLQVIQWTGHEVTGPTGAWFLLIPPAEHGNLTAEMAAYQGSKSQYVGVVIDDFWVSPPPPGGYPANSLPAIYRGLVSETNVCIVLYPNWGQPGVAAGASCVIVPIPLGPTTESAVLADLSGFKAGAVMPLAYGAPVNHWEGPLPASSVYSDVIRQAAEQKGVPMVVWN